MGPLFLKWFTSKTCSQPSRPIWPLGRSLIRLASPDAIRRRAGSSVGVSAGQCLPQPRGAWPSWAGLQAHQEGSGLIGYAHWGLECLRQGQSLCHTREIMLARNPSPRGQTLSPRPLPEQQLLRNLSKMFRNGFSPQWALKKEEAGQPKQRTGWRGWR